MDGYAVRTSQEMGRAREWGFGWQRRGEQKGSRGSLKPRARLEGQVWGGSLVREGGREKQTAHDCIV